MGLRDWLCYDLGQDFPVPRRYWDYEDAFKKWMHYDHDTYQTNRDAKPTYSTCMDFLMGVHNRIKEVTNLHGAAQYFQPFWLDSMYPPAYHTFDMGDIPQSGDFYVCSISGGRHVGVFLEVSEDNLRIVCGGADQGGRGAIAMAYAWPDNLLGWLNIAEFYGCE